MTLNGAIIQLVQMRESKYMPTMFKPLFDKVIETVSECEEPGTPSAQPETIRCAECKWYGRADKRRFYRGMDCLQNRIDTIIPDKDFCSRAERREE